MPQPDPNPPQAHRRGVTSHWPLGRLLPPLALALSACTQLQPICKAAAPLAGPALAVPHGPTIVAAATVACIANDALADIETLLQPTP